VEITPDLLRPIDGITITPEMIAAGRHALAIFSYDYASFEEGAVAIFRAMLAARKINRPKVTRTKAAASALLCPFRGLPE